MKIKLNIDIFKPQCNKQRFNHFCYLHINNTILALFSTYIWVSFNVFFWQFALGNAFEFWKVLKRFFFYFHPFSKFKFSIYSTVMTPNFAKSHNFVAVQ